MKYDIILVPFPFDDLTTNKLRPAICLTQVIGSYNHIVLAFVTSQIHKAKEKSDLQIKMSDLGFSITGLKVDSAIRLHRLVTVDVSIINRKLGVLPTAYHSDLQDKLKELFDL